MNNPRNQGSWVRTSRVRWKCDFGATRTLAFGVLEYEDGDAGRVVTGFVPQLDKVITTT